MAKAARVTRGARKGLGLPAGFASPRYPDKVWAPFVSSCLARAMFAGTGSKGLRPEDSPVGRLWLVFWNKTAAGVRQSKIYFYPVVPRTVWTGLLAAPSKGTFYHQVIKPGYGK